MSLNRFAATAELTVSGKIRETPRMPARDCWGYLYGVSAQIRAGATLEQLDMLSAQSWFELYLSGEAYRFRGPYLSCPFAEVPLLIPGTRGGVTVNQGRAARAYLDLTIDHMPIEIAPIDQVAVLLRFEDENPPDEAGRYKCRPWSSFPGELVVAIQFHGVRRPAA